MKKTIKFFGILAILAVIIFSMAACGDGTENDNDGGSLEGESPFEGTWNETEQIDWVLHLIVTGSSWKLSYLDYPSLSWEGTFTRSGNTAVISGDLSGTAIVSGNSLTLDINNWEGIIVFTRDGSSSGNGGNGIKIPSTPTGVSATTLSSSSIQISWNAVSGATSYRVYRSTSASGTFNQVGNPTSTPFTDAGLSANTTYWYRVSATNSAGESSQSDVVSATTQSSGGGITMPSTPTGVSATALSSSSIQISWNAVSGAISYRVYRSTSASGTFNQVDNPTSTSFTDAGLSASTMYWYRVSAINSAGESSQSDVVSATTQSSGGGITMPSTPTGVSATALSSSSIQVSWYAVSGAISYRVYRSTSASGTFNQVGNPTSTSFTDTGLSASATYWYRVSAINSAGEGNNSTAVSATTQSGITIPSAPTGVTATAQSSSSIQVSWYAVSGATSYSVEVRTTSTGTWSYLTTVSGNSYTHTGLSANTQRWYRVFAINSAGTSSASLIVNATTSQAVFGLQEAHSAFLQAGGSTYSSVFPIGNFTWNASSSILSYTSSPPGTGSSGVRGFEATTGSPASSMLFFIEMEVVFNASRQITTVRHRYVITYAFGITGLNPSSPTSTNPHRTSWYNNPTIGDSIIVPGVVLTRNIGQTTTLPFINGTWRRTN
ncbi:MAG: fibronectin type III domain-containing protein [Treponema sp.]|nr:fibronectin type III domain-containing protein [Treponema sp.]